MATPPLPAPTSDRIIPASPEDNNPSHLGASPTSTNSTSDASRPPNARPQASSPRFTPFASETNPTSTSNPSQTSQHSPPPPQSKAAASSAYGARSNPHTPSLPRTPVQLHPESIDIRHHDPLPLTASQEAEVRDLYYANVRRACSQQIKAFAECCTGRTFSISWACRQERKGMNSCMNGVAGRRAEDEAREEWFRGIPERAEGRRREEEWKEEQRRRKREWWGLDENGRRIVEGEGENKERRS